MTKTNTNELSLQNWKGDIEYHPAKVVPVTSVEDIQRVVQDQVTYPSPVRVRGSHHSTTNCVVADGGTVLDMSSYNRILNIDPISLTLTTQAGVIQLDAAKALEKAGLQLYTNLEIGNMTLGSGATGQTKDASYYADGAWEYGQFNSYCVGVKTVQPDGTLLEVTEQNNPELMRAMRSSFGMLGVVYEVTFRVKPISTMVVKHESYSTKEFVDRLEQLTQRNTSMMMYLYPFNDRVVVEYRYDNPDDTVTTRSSGSTVWKIRNYTWKTVWPFIANVLHFLPLRKLRNAIHHALNMITGWVQTGLLKDSRSSPADQIIRYSETGGFASYTFSIWAVPKEQYGQALLDYFEFCRQYEKENGYRCELLNVGYHIKEDRSSLFSYSQDGDVLTLDPVATGRGGWFEFLDAYNQFCAERGGRPLLNQTPRLTPHQVQRSMKEGVLEFKKYLKDMDPEERFMNQFFRHLFSTV